MSSCSYLSFSGEKLIQDEKELFSERGFISWHRKPKLVVHCFVCSGCEHRLSLDPVLRCLVADPCTLQWGFRKLQGNFQLN